MQFLTPFTQMDGPVFLVLYAVLFAAFFCACMVLRRQVDQDKTGRPVQAGVDPDPYQMAYLRGGVNEVNRLATFELFERRALEEKKSWNGSITWTLIPGIVNASNCSPFALAASSFYSEPRRPTEIFRSEVASRFVSQFREWDDWIEKEDLRITPEKQFKLNGLALVLAAVFAAVGLLKIVAAVLHDRYNVGFASLMLIAGTVAIVVTRFPRRFNARGRSFLTATQVINGQHRRITTQNNRSTIPSEESASNGFATMPMMAMGLFGVAALQGSSYDSFRKTYQKSEPAGGGCGASCAGASWSSGCGSSHHDGTLNGAHCGAGAAHCSAGGTSCGASSGASCSGGGAGGCGGGCGGGGCGGS